jgi:hypothetical protein
MTLYRHQCGQRYSRTTTTTPPRNRLVICERCLEPMPLCDEQRAAYIYEPINEISLKRLTEPLLSIAAQSSKSLLDHRPLGRMLALRTQTSA